MTDPYVTFEQTDPETGNVVATGITQQSIIEALIAAGKSYRIVRVINQDTPPQDTQG